MAIKTFSPPAKRFTRVVEIQTPGARIIEVPEEDFTKEECAMDDETLALAYSETTGLSVTVRTVYQTTVSPIDPKYEEKQVNDR